jgi:hypothetical protein
MSSCLRFTRAQPYREAYKCGCEQHDTTEHKNKQYYSGGNAKLFSNWFVQGKKSLQMISSSKLRLAPQPHWRSGIRHRFLDRFPSLRCKMRQCIGRMRSNHLSHLRAISDVEQGWKAVYAEPNGEGPIFGCIHHSEVGFAYKHGLAACSTTA